MKVSKDKPVFVPITIVIETEEELNVLLHGLYVMSGAGMDAAQRSRAHVMHVKIKNEYAK